jgi:hypothetical protein
MRRGENEEREEGKREEGGERGGGIMRGGRTWCRQYATERIVELKSTSVPAPRMKKATRASAGTSENL